MGFIWLWKTTQSHLRIAEAARTQLYCEGSLLSVAGYLIQEPGFVCHEWSVDIKERRPLLIEKIVALYNSRDHGISECGLEGATSHRASKPV